MFDRDRWQEIWFALKQNKLRSILTAFGVFWGIFMIVVMMGSGKGLQNGAYDGMGGFATNSSFMWAQRTTVPYKGFKKGRWYNFDNTDTKALKEQIPEIELLAPRLEARFGSGQNNVVRGLKTGAFNISGDYPDYFRIDPVNLVQGRLINDDDIKYKRKVALMGTRVKDVLFKPDEDPVGQYIRIRGVYFMVVGIYKSQHKGGWAEWQETSISLPLTTLQQTFNYGEAVGWYSVTSRGDVSVTVVEDKMKELLKRRHSVSPDDKEAIGSHNVEKEFKKMTILFTGIHVLILIVGIGTLFAGAVGVSNIMLFIVKERTKEIGIQRALGATPFKIISQIMMESISLTMVAGYVGLLLGVAVIEGMSYGLSKAAAASAEPSMFTRPEVDFGVALAALLTLVFFGALAGLIPAQRAVSIKPIDALRYE